MFTLALSPEAHGRAVRHVFTPPDIEHDEGEKFIRVVPLPSAVLLPEAVDKVPIEDSFPPRYANVVSRLLPQRMPRGLTCFKIGIEYGNNPMSQWSVESFYGCGPSDRREEIGKGLS